MLAILIYFPLLVNHLKIYYNDVMGHIPHIKTSLSHTPYSIPPTPCNGFTLIEVLIVTTIIAATSLLTFLTVPQYLDRQNLLRTANVVVSHLRDTQNDSVITKNAKQYAIRFYPNQLETLQVQTDSSLKIERTIPFPRQLTLQYNLANNQNVIYFTKLTGRPNTTANLTLKSSRYQIPVTVNSNGQISQSELTKLN